MTEVSDYGSGAMWEVREHPIREFFTDESIRWINLEELFISLCLKQDRSEKENELLIMLGYYRSSVAAIPDPRQPRGLPRRHLYYDWDGTPIQQWEAILKGEYFDRSVAKDVINGWLISTVWLMINHAYFKEQPAIMFETMIFKDDADAPNNEELVDFQERYCSYPEAQEGHERACELVRKETSD